MRIRRMKILVVAICFLLTAPVTTTITSIDECTFSLAQNESPSARFLPGFAYDAVNERIMMFGGMNNVERFNETWVLDTDTGVWTELEPEVSPSSRGSCAMVYSSVDEVIILFGGHDGVTWVSDTWVFDCNSESWTEMNPSTAPPGRGSHAMVYDSVNDKVLVFSGYGEGGADVADMWAYDYSSNTWEEMFPAESPHERYGAACAYDIIEETMIIFGGNSNGYLSDTWSYDYATDSWSELDSDMHPPALKWSQMVYDSHEEKTILFGGDNVLSQPEDVTWIFDSSTNNWTEREPQVSPPAREAFGFAFDSSVNKAVLFGGLENGSDALSGTWSYDYELDIWEEIDSEGQTDSAPPPNNELLGIIVILATGAIMVILTFILIRKRR